MLDIQWGKAIHLSEQHLEAVVADARKVDHQQIKKLTDSMDGRLMTVIEKKGGYIGHWIFVEMSEVLFICYSYSNKWK